MSQSGIFISLEGGEGSGKSTQIKKLQAWLNEAHPNRTIITTREPGGTPSAEDIRALLVQGDTDRLKPKTDALLMLASRVEHVERLIAPSLEQGAIILCDRFADSSYVYQTLTGGYSEAELRDLHKLSIGTIMPDRTYLMDLPAEEGLARANSRASQTEARFEGKGLAYHEQVREHYLSLAKQEPNRFMVIEASRSEDEIFQQLQSDVQALLDDKLR